MQLCKLQSYRKKQYMQRDLLSSYAMIFTLSQFIISTIILVTINIEEDMRRRTKNIDHVIGFYHLHSALNRNQSLSHVHLSTEFSFTWNLRFLPYAFLHYLSTIPHFSSFHHQLVFQQFCHPKKPTTFTSKISSTW